MSRKRVRDRSLHRRVSFTLQAILAVGMILSLWGGQWMNAFLVGFILVLTLIPLLLNRSLAVYIPPEFELVAVLFIFASLFLGKVHGFYFRYPWWDEALHTISGFLLGVVGFLLVYVLNEEPDVELSMRPGFVALFAFVFSLAMGGLWEIFEFGMDSVFGLNMQRGSLEDTMSDLIVDAAGALVVAVLGYQYLKGGAHSFLEDWLHRFVDANPRFPGE